VKHSKHSTFYSTENLTLGAGWHVEHLIVHLGRPGPTIECGSHEFAWDHLETIGVGDFTIFRNGKQYMQITRTVPALTPDQKAC
jgi:hypothetical protein